MNYQWKPEEDVRSLWNPYKWLLAAMWVLRIIFPNTSIRNKHIFLQPSFGSRSASMQLFIYYWEILPESHLIVVIWSRVLPDQKVVIFFLS